MKCQPALITLCAFLTVNGKVDGISEGISLEYNDEEGRESRLILAILTMSQLSGLGQVCPIKTIHRDTKSFDSHPHSHHQNSTHVVFHSLYYQTVNWDLNSNSTDKLWDRDYKFSSPTGRVKLKIPSRFLNNCENQLLYIRDSHIWLPEFEQGFPSNQNFYFFIGHSRDETAIEQMFHLPELLSLKHKVGLSVDKGRIYVEIKPSSVRSFIWVHSAFTNANNGNHADITVKHLEKLFSHPPFLNTGGVLDLLKDTKLRVKTYTFPYFLLTTEDGEKLGMSNLFVEITSRALNTTFEYGIQPDLYMKRNKDGSWPGSYAELIERRLDILLAATTKLDHIYHLTYVTHSFSAQVHFSTSYAKPLGLKMTALLTPFDMELWLAVFASFMTFVLLIFAHTWKIQDIVYGPPPIERTITNETELETDTENIVETQAKIDVETEINVKTEGEVITKTEVKTEDEAKVFLPPIWDIFSTAFLTAFGPMFGQGVNIPRGLWLLLLTWFAATFMINAYYNQDLLAAITVPELESKPRDFAQLAERKDYTIYMIRIPGGAMNLFLYESKSSAIATIRAKMKPIPYKDRLECAILAATKAKTVCINWDLHQDAIEAKNMSLKSGWKTLVKSEAVYSRVAGPVVRRNSKYLEGLNAVVGQLMDMHIFTRTYDDVISYLTKQGVAYMNSPQQKRSSLYQEMRASMDDVLNADQVLPFKMNVLTVPFCVWAAGILLAGSSFVFWEASDFVVICLSSKIKKLIL